MTYKADLDAELLGAVTLGYSADKAMRKVFSYNSSVILKQFPREGFEIFNAVADRFRIPFRSVQVVGSAQTGYSYFKGRDFVQGGSDLDLAIVDGTLFSRYAELSFIATNGYTDLTAFQKRADVGEFHQYLVRGIFRPDLMPRCSMKQDWFTFFNRLSTSYSEIFDDINCGIYLSDTFFEAKQRPLLAAFREQNQ